MLSSAMYEVNLCVSETEEMEENIQRGKSCQQPVCEQAIATRRPTGRGLMRFTYLSHLMQGPTRLHTRDTNDSLESIICTQSNFPY